MAIIPCIECGHHVSEYAASCPSCGVPIAPAVTPAVKAKPRTGRGIARVLITLMVLWSLGTMLWFTLPNGAPNELMTRAKLILQPEKHTVVSAPTPPAPVPQPDKDSAAVTTVAASPPAAAPPLYKAQLYTGDDVHVECDKVSQSGPILKGDGCSLAFVDTRTRQVNLALILASETGAARVYVVGPMSQTDCQTRGDEISSRLQGKQQGEHLVWKNCADAARESILPAGCNLNSPSVPLPEVPTAHLWRYDCGSSNVTRTTTTSQTPPHKSRPNRSRGNGALLVTAAGPEPEPAASSNIRLASADGAYIGGATTITRVPAQDASVAHPPQGRNANATDDLARVRATDPTAADHIATYCSKTAPLSNRDALMAECRRNEAEAWTRLVQQNEFPTLDEATRKKCSAPPFPDTYVAKESCARYALSAN